MDNSYNSVTGGELMTDGRHYWEVEITACEEYDSENGAECNMIIGATRPGLDHTDGIKTWNASAGDTAYFMCGLSGNLWGGGKEGYREKYSEGYFEQDERIGCLLDLDAGWMRFFRNGKLCGPGFESGVTGPLVRTVGLSTAGEVVTALPISEAPEWVFTWEPGDDSEDD